jgi:DNA-binding protein WhiA
MIDFIDKKLGLDRLPPSLEAVARLRRQYPDASFAELGALMDPPLSKSGVSARMRRLESLAEEIANK